jgi:chromosome segregation ATPase
MTKRITKSALLALFLCAAPIPALVLTAGAEAEVDFDDDAEAEAYWRAQARELRAQRDAARQRYEAAHTTYKKMRQKNYPTGEARAKITTEYQDAEAALAKAEQEIEELPERARRAGAAPGWIRE